MNVEFIKPTTIKEVLELLDQYSARAVIVNGGTDIVSKIACDEVTPEVIISIRDIPELKKISESDGYFSFGGAVTYKEMIESPILQPLKGLLQAAEEVGSPPIRNVATPAGNIANGAPAADCSVMMMALEADVIIACKTGQRVLSLPDTLSDPFVTTIKDYELIQEIRIPILKPNTYTAFEKMKRRKTQDISRVSVGVCLTIEDGLCKNVSIALGAVNKVPVRACSLEKLLIGKELEQGLAAIHDHFPEEATPRRSYKKLVTNPVIERAVRKAWGSSVTGGVKIG
jgi:CO/xanthine dehydrogenase FAD-binding subunit